MGRKLLRVFLSVFDRWVSSAREQISQIQSRPDAESLAGKTRGYHTDTIRQEGQHHKERRVILKEENEVMRKGIQMQDEIAKLLQEASNLVTP